MFISFANLALSHSLSVGTISIILPYIISFAVGFSVSDETCAGLIQVLAALRALQAGCVPLQVRRDSQYVLVMDLASTSYTHGESLLLCREHTRKSHTRNPRHSFFWSLQYSTCQELQSGLFRCRGELLFCGTHNGWCYVREWYHAIFFK